MTWKKRIGAVLCALALLLTLSPPPAGAAGEVIFIALNEWVPNKLSASTMPIFYNGTYYVPYVIFDINYLNANFGTSVDLGVRVAGSSNTLLLYNKRRQLIYDLETGTCTDKQGNSYRAAVIRGGVTYVPVVTVRDFFSADGLKVTQRGTAYGPLLRFTTPDVQLSDDNFIDAAQAPSSILPKLYREYSNSQTPPPTPPPVTPSPPSVTPSPPPGQTPDKSGVRVNFAFQCTGGPMSGALLSAVEREGFGALFFFRPGDLAENEALIRRMVGGGHAVGLTVPSGENAREQLREGNRILSLIAHMNTRTVLLENGGDAAALEGEGWSVWRANVKAARGRTDQAHSANLLRAIGAKRSVAKLLLGDDATGALPPLLSALREEKYSIRLPVGGEVD